MTIAHVLTDKGRQVVTAEPTLQILAAARKLVEYRIGYLVVVDTAGLVVGVLSERDIIRGLTLHGASAAQMTVADLMTADPVSCAPGDAPGDVLRKMNQLGFRHMPVLDGGKLKGIISSRDIIKYLLDRANVDKSTLRTLNELGIY